MAVCNKAPHLQRKVLLLLLRNRLAMSKAKLNLPHLHRHIQFQPLSVIIAIYEFMADSANSLFGPCSIQFDQTI